MSAPLSLVPEVFDPATVGEFRHLGMAVDRGEVRFRYALDGIELAEQYRFPWPGDPEPGRVAAFHRVLVHLGIVAGISYYKAAAPPRVVLPPAPLVADDLAFHRCVLAKGLGEYAFHNGLDAELSPELVATGRDRAPGTPPLPLELANGPLVPVGGGKDSCVTIELLRNSGHLPTLITVNRYPVIGDVIRRAGLPDMNVERRLDPALRLLNERGARNGHVPATAIVSLAVAATAALHGHGAVIMSNERSASEGNVVYQGVEINHQWSKSADAERLIAGLLARAAPGLAYFSLLRPYSELSITRLFHQRAGRYLDVFSSCNRNFHLEPTKRGATRWCGRCPKCQFVFLALATVMPPADLERVFGHDVLAVSPLEGWRQLVGLSEWKPFECVGETVECAVAVRLVSQRPGWAGHPTLAALERELRHHARWPTGADVERVLTPADPATIPPPFRAALA